MSSRSYWKIVFDMAWKRAWSGANMKYIIPALAFTLSRTSCYGLFALANLVPYPVFRDNATATLIIQLGQVIVPIAVLVFLAAKGISSIPPEIHNEKIDQIMGRDNQIKDLKDRWECVPIQANLGIECLTDEPNHRVSIKIHNPLAQKLDDLTVELVSFICIGQMYGRAPQDLNPASPHRFSRGEGKESGAILPCDSTTIYIAELDQVENIVFLPKSNADFAQLANALASAENAQD